MNPASYYIWKWADNDVRGKPNEVFAALMRGQMHPAIQPFDATELGKGLEEAAVEARKRGDEWEWQSQMDKSTGLTRFISLTAPEFPKKPAHSPIANSLWKLGFASYHEQAGRLRFGPPKHSCAMYIDLPWVYEVEEADLPVLLRAIPVRTSSPFVVLVDRRNWFVQAFTDGKHWIVEWRENYNLRDPSQYDQWIAGHRPVSRKRTRVKSVIGKGPPCRESEKLTYAEVLGVFRAFLRGEPKPTRYHWRSIKKELK